MAAYGITISDIHGHVYDGRAGLAHVSFPVAVEAVAIQAEIEYAAQHQGHFAILTDCLMLASILTGGSNSWPWDRATLIAKLQSALAINLDISISFVTPRRHNVRADWVARSFAHGSLPQDWIQIQGRIWGWGSPGHGPPHSWI
ncbi:hypothetical protein LINPERHAP1_LOCUS5410 [Linum perenne]